MTGSDQEPVPSFVAEESAHLKPSYLPVLDGLRGIAVLLVLLGHLPGRLFPQGMQRLDLGANLGVHLFFVLSGFLITRNLLAAQTGLWSFYVRRLLRLTPALWICVAAVQTVHPDFMGPVALLYLGNMVPLEVHPLMHTWSLAVEEQFYLIWPPILALLRWPRARIVVALAIPFFLASMPSVASLACGVLLAAIPWKKEQAQSAWGRPGAIWLVPPLLILLAGLVVLLLPPNLPRGGMTFVLVATAAVLVSLLAPSAALLLPPLRWTGRISYGLYLYHLPIYWAFGVAGETEQPPGLLTCLLAILASFLAAAMSFYWVERPIMRCPARTAPALSAAAAP